MSVSVSEQRTPTNANEQIFYAISPPLDPALYNLRKVSFEVDLPSADALADPLVDVGFEEVQLRLGRGFNLGRRGEDLRHHTEVHTRREQGAGGGSRGEGGRAETAAAAQVEVAEFVVQLAFAGGLTAAVPPAPIALSVGFGNHRGGC